MNQTQFEKLRDDTSKLVTKIQSLRDKTGKPGTLKDFKDFEQVERFGDALWEHGLKAIYVCGLLKETNHLKKQKDWSKIESNLLSLSQKLHPYSSNHETVTNLKEVLDAAIKKVKVQAPDKRDFEILTKIINKLANPEQKIVRTITKKINLKSYRIRSLVKDMEEFGFWLKEGGLKTNQIRKFLDAVNNLKLKIAQKKKQRKNDELLVICEEHTIDTELVLLKQKIAYASARQDSVKPLKEVMDVAIDRVKDSEDFERFFQLVESIIAYHKYAGGGE